MLRDIQFDWDSGNWPKCGKHGVLKAEIEFVLSNDPIILPDRFPNEREVRFDAVGRSAGDRHVFVVFTIRPLDSGPAFRPISARYMHRKEIANYERQKKT